MKTGTIYIIRNDINNKVYIGQTIQKLHARFSQHKYKAKQRNHKISKAIKENGAEHFYIEALEENVEQAKLKSLEEKYIKKYNSVENGYNITYRDTMCRSQKEIRIEDMISLYERGMTLKNIGSIYGTSKATISRTLKENGIAIRDWNKEQSVGLTKEKLYIEYVENKKTASCIAKEVGLSRTAVVNWLKKFNLYNATM